MSANSVGLQRLFARLDQLTAQLEREVMGRALQSGANVLLAEAKANLSSNGSVQSGELRNGLHVVTQQQAGRVIAHVRASGRHAHLANWIEHGTAAHAIHPGGAQSLRISGAYAESAHHPGVRAKPFMRPALDTQAQAALAAVAESLKASVEAA